MNARHLLQAFINAKLRRKLFILNIAIISLLIIASSLALYNEFLGNQNNLKLIEQTMRSSYDKNIKNQVENVITLLDGVYKKYESGELTLEQSQQMGADLVRNLRYNEEGYFWIDTTEGDNVVLLGSDTEGTNRYNFQDSNGMFVVKDFIELAQQSGGGYLDYWFPRANQTEPLIKRGYVELFEPFNWVVGTGNYIDDINLMINEKQQSINIAFQNKILIVSASFLFIIFSAILLSFYISRSITKPLHKTISIANSISNGFLDEEQDYKIVERKDEVGQLATSIEKMKVSLKVLIDELTDKTKTLELEKELFSTTLKSIGDGVISTNQLGEIVLLNTAAEVITGWKQEEASGKPFEEIFNIINEDTREKCVSPVIRALQHKKAIFLENHTLLITKAGIEIPIEDSAAPITDKIGSIVGTVVAFRDCSDKKEKQKLIQYLSYHDQLTSLYNRHFFVEELTRLDVDRNLPFSIAMLDVNGLKLTNDAFGHETGDLLLKSVAEVLKNECRSDDIISRIGGDEFVVLLPKTTHETAESIVRRIYKAIDNQRIDNIIVSVSIGLETKEAPHQDIKEVLTRAEENMYRNKITESQSMRNQTIKVILHTLHESNPREKIHSERVSKLCRKIGEAMLLDNDVLKELEIAGLMHDIGKIAINNEILNKPGKLTDAEYDEIKKHPEISYHILKSADVYTRLAESVLSHHERWDGKGYPRGLASKETPIIARIIAVADAYEAMTANRPYKEPLSHEQAIDELKRCSGTQFDSEIVNVFIQCCSF